MPYFDIVPLDKETKDSMDLYHKNKRDMGVISELTDLPFLKYLDSDNYMCIICRDSLKKSSRNSHLKTNNHKRNYISYYEREKKGIPPSEFRYNKIRL